MAAQGNSGSKATPMEQLVEASRIAPMPLDLLQPDKEHPGQAPTWFKLEVQSFRHILCLDDLPTPRYIPARAEWANGPGGTHPQLQQLTSSTGHTYVPGRRLQQTNFGFVYGAEAYDAHGKFIKQVALKFSRADWVHKRAFYKLNDKTGAFEASPRSSTEDPCHEVQAMRLLGFHPNITQLHSVMGTDEHLILAYEFNEGGDLIDDFAAGSEDRMAEIRASRLAGVPVAAVGAGDYLFAERDLKRRLHQIALGIQYMHARGIVHRDLSLENVMLDSENVRSSSVKLIDFGMCTSVPLPRGGPTPGKRCGKPSYAAPEVCQPRDQTEDLRKADVWCLGVMMHMQLVCAFPYDNWQARNLQAEGDWAAKRAVVPHQLRDLLLHMLEQDPAQRYSIDDVLAHPWLAGLQAALPAAGTGLPLNVNANQQELVQWLAGATAEAQRAGGRLSAATVDAAPGAWGVDWRQRYVAAMAPAGRAEQDAGDGPPDCKSLTQETVLQSTPKSGSPVHGGAAAGSGAAGTGVGGTGVELGGSVDYGGTAVGAEDTAPALASSANAGAAFVSRQFSD